MAELKDILAMVAGLPSDKADAIAKDALAETKDMPWIPNPGPQSEAYFCQADVLFYGGAGGGGKTALDLGLAFTQHRRSLIMRRHYTDLSGLIEEAIGLNKGRDGFNGTVPPTLRTKDKRLLEFGAAQRSGDEAHWQGRPHDLLAIDEAAQFLKTQILFLMGWVRSTDPTQRCRVIFTSNPPLTSEGTWLIEMFRPWLDPTHANPARPGELRWFVTSPEGHDLETDGPAPVDFGGKLHQPKSRTFIKALLADNPFLANTGYAATLDALPEPMRSAVRDGNFIGSQRDDEWQAIPSAWIRAAQERWTKTPPPGVPMCAIGADVARGGEDDNVLAPRHDGWFAPLIVVPGRKTPRGADVAGLIVAYRRDDATVIIDMGGGYGGAPYEHLKTQGSNFPIIAYNGTERSRARTRDRKLGFYNKRSQAYWQFREALDPGQPGESPIMLPPSPRLVSDLAAPTFEVDRGSIRIESKEHVVKRLGRSPDYADAVVMAWAEGARALTTGYGSASDEHGGFRSGGPKIQRQAIMAYPAQRRYAR